MLKHVLAGALLLMAAVMAAGGGEFARGPLAAGDAEGNVALAQGGAGADGDAVTVELRVWQLVTNADVLYVSARPQGGSWRTLGTIEFPLDDGHSADGSRRYGQLTVGDIELRVWQGVGDPLSISITARHVDGEWFSLGALALDDGVSSGGHYRYGDLTIVSSADPGVAFTPSGADIPRLATATITFLNPPLVTDAARLVAIDPPIEGSFAWDGDRTLLFQPAFPGWQRGQRYLVRVDGPAAGLARDYTHAFTVEGGLEVAYVIPGDGDVEVPVEAQILVQFNRSVAALTVLQEGAAPPVLEFDPPLAGKGEWLNTSLYRFIPSDLQPATAYRVRIPAGLTSAADGVLESDITWSFETIQPVVASFEPANDTKWVEPDAPVVVTFNQPMDRASAEARVALRAADGTPVAATFEWSEGDTVATLAPEALLTLGGLYELVVPAGVEGAAGGATRTVRLTRFTVAETPGLVSWSRSFSARHMWMSLTYNNPMDPDSFEGRVTVSGVDPDDIRIDWSDRRPERVRLDFPAEHETTYTVRIAPGVQDRGGRATTAVQTSTFTTEKEWLFPELTLAAPASFVTYAANNEQVLYFDAQKIEEAQFSLHRLSDAEAELLLRRGAIDRGTGFWPDSDPIRTWTEPIAEELRDTSRVYSTTLGDGEPLAKGHYFLFATFDEASEWKQTKLVVSVVDTAIVTKLASDELVVWALDYESGTPLVEAPVTTAPLESPPTTPYQAGNTDAQGVARFAVTPPETVSYWTRYGDHVVRMEEGGRFGVASTWWDMGADPWDLGASSYIPEPVGHLYTDRPIYRPGETVSFKGVLRDEDDASYSVPGPGTEVTISIRDSRYNWIHETTTELDELGTVSGEVALAANAPTGRYRVWLVGSAGGRVTTSFTVAEFRVPEFLVEVEAGAAEYVSRDNIDTEARADFYFGGAVRDAAVTWAARSSPTTIRVEGYEDYSFSEYDYYARTRTSGDPIRSEGEARTDDSGIARFEVPATLEEGAGTREVTISATVTDTSGRAVAGSTEAVVHPATWYAGIKPESYLGKAEEPLTIHLVTVDYEGAIAPGRPVTVRVYEREWVRTKERTSSGWYYYRSEPVDTEIQVRSATTDGKGEGSFAFAPPKSGGYRLVAESTDDEGRIARSSRFVWATGRDYVPWPVRFDDIIELIADREEYEVGDVAEVLVPAPFAGSTALVTIERGRVLSTEVRKLETNSEVLRIPIEDAHIPNIFVGVVLYRPPTEDDPYPRYSLGNVELPVSTAPRRLDVRVEPDRDEAVPGDIVPYEVTVTDAEGRGVAADVSVAVVDQAVLALAADQSPDGIEAFWYPRRLGVHTTSSLAVLVNRWNETYRETEPAEEGGVRGGAWNEASRGGGTVNAMAAPASAREAGFATFTSAPADSGTRVRSDFRHTALWVGQLTTGADGTATFDLPLPDNTTTWRAFARARTTATQVGEGESELRATQPLLVRPSLPRFLRVGDDVRLRTLVTNRTAQALALTVTIEATGVTLDDNRARSLTVEPGETGIFEWPARALEEGTAVVRFDAVSTAGYADAVEIGLPVHLDVTPEATATGGIVEDSPAVEAVYLPEYLIAGQGSLELSLQGSLVGALDEELEHFKPYKYESTIRIASRVVAIVAAQRATAGGLDAAWEHQLRDDVQQLINRRTYVYDWGYGQAWGWCLRCSPDPLVTGWVLLALGEARDAGHNVPDDVLDGAASAISSYLERQTDVERPADPNQHAFLLYALTDASNPGREVSETAREQAPRMLALVEEHRANLTNWGRAYVVLGLLATGHDADHGAVRAMLNDLTADTIASANGNHWEEDRIPGSMHNGSVRITAIVLRALTEVDPRHPLIEETARWLALARSADRWKTTVERAQGMASLGAYAELTGETRGVYDYSVRVNTTEVLDGHFDVPAGDYLDSTSVALADLPLGEVSRVQFEREAGEPGRLYYGLNLRYVTPAAGIEALNRGFAVSHRYSLLDDPETPITSAAPGDVVRVTVTVIAPADRLFVQVQDFLPAGLEPIDPQLRIVSPRLREQLREDRVEALQASTPAYYAPWYRWYYSPWDQVDLRDDRVVLQASRLPQGVHEYVYYARATTPGDFFVAPVHAEETYLPEVFGRSDSSRFTVTSGE